MRLYRIASVQSLTHQILRWRACVLCLCAVLAYSDDAHRFEEDFELELHHGGGGVAPGRSQSARAAVRHRPDVPPLSTGSTTSAQEAGVGGAGDADKLLAEQKRT